MIPPEKPRRITTERDDLLLVAGIVAILSGFWAVFLIYGG